MGIRRIIRGIGQRLEQQAHSLLALAVLVSGIWFIAPLLVGVLRGEHVVWFAQDSWREVLDTIGLSQLPRVVISLSLVLMSFGLLSRARVAWAFTLVVLLPAIAIPLYTSRTGMPPEAIYNTVLFLALIRFRAAFYRSSVAAGTLFAMSSLASLLWYAILGGLYLGHEFAPKILTLPDAVYFSIVAIATVGFGDIVPVTETSRLFVVSVILLGVTVFTSGVGAIIAPVTAGALRQIIQRKARLSMKKDHIVLCGATPLAHTLYQSLINRGEQVTVVLKEGVKHNYPASADIIVGDAATDETLEEAGVRQASYVLAMLEEDPDNAFIVLAVKAIDNCQAKTVAVVNNSQNLEKIRTVKPDLVFSPQLLGAELLSRMLRGEKIDMDLVSHLFVFKPTPESGVETTATSNKT